MSREIVYVLKNEGMRGLLKIGHTTASVQDRMRALYGVGVPFPFECVKAVALRDGFKAKDVEFALHQAFSRHRVNPRREFFRIDEDCVVPLLDLLEQDNASEEVQAALDADAGAEDKQSRDAEKRRRAHLLFSMTPVSPGDEIAFIHPSAEGGKLTAIVQDDQKTVEYDGATMQCNEATRKAWSDAGKGEMRTSFQWGLFWKFEGRKLTNLRDEFED